MHIFKHVAQSRWTSGSARLLTTDSQNQEICYDFLPFGERIAADVDGRTSNCYTSSANPLTQKFTGMERDQNSESDFFQARYMSAQQGRFRSADPLGNFVADLTNPQSWNMYSYALNNPLAFIDPTGTCSLGDDGVYHDDPDEPCVAPGDNGVTVNGGAPPPVPEYQEEEDDSIAPTFVAFGFGLPSTAPTGSYTRRFACAAEFGQNHSIAAAFGAQKTFIGNLLGGNTFSGLTDLGLLVFGPKTPDANIAGSVLLGGARGGLPGGGAGSKGPAGMISEALSSGAVYGGYNLGQAIYNFPGAALRVALTTPGSAAENAALAADLVTPLAQSSVSVAVSAITWSKLAWDLGTIGWGYFVTCK